MPKSTLYLVAIIPMNPLQPDGIEEAMSSARWHFGRKILSEELNEVNVEWVNVLNTPYIDWRALSGKHRSGFQIFCRPQGK